MEKLRDSWDGTKISFEKDRAYGFSWPQRNYICSFCKKEFKSAQALGGHMNVHRRDRARLRLHSPSFMDSPNPNPNPNNNLHNFPLPSSNFSCLPEEVPVIEHPKGDDVVKNKGVMLELMDATRVWKAKEFLRFDLNMDLLRDAKEDLDLELRLGYS